MQFKKTTVAAAALAATSMASYVPSEPWTTLTATGTYSGAITDYASTFGIAVNPISTASASASATTTAKAKRADAISQIGDGQIQATTSTAPTTSTTSTKSTIQAISQITDGQIQAPTSTVSTSTTKSVSTIQAISQIGDGQIQATTATSSTTTSKSTIQAVSQITDGQIQATTSTTASGADASETSASETSSSSSAATSAKATDSSDPVSVESCFTNSTLAMTLEDGVLRDSKGRIGSIVANRQFQFDGPPPQAGAIYAKGWGITPEGNLALGDDDVFYQCLSGDFYNLYDESIGSQCKPVHLEAIDLVSC